MSKCITSYGLTQKVEPYCGVIEAGDDGCKGIIMADRIRVLTIVSSLALGELSGGGAGRFGIELARNLDADRFESIVCSFWRHDALSEQHWADYLTKVGVEVLFAADRGREFDPPKYIRGFSNIASYFRERPVDVIHSHFQLGSIAALSLKRTLKAKAMVRTAHGSVRWEWSNTVHGFLCRQIFTKWLFPLMFDAEAGVSRSAVSSLNRRPGTRIIGKKVLLLHNGISLDRFVKAGRNPTKRLEIGLSPHDLVIGSVGRLSEQKGYTFLIEAAPTVIAKFPNVKFIIIGDGELRDSLHRKTEQLGLSETVIFAGHRQDVESLYGIMDLFVLPSLWEGLPTAVLESMACGVPVVATDIPGTRELIQVNQTGWLAQPRDPINLAACILEALNSPAKRAALAQTALQDVVPRFSMAHIARQYEQLYRELVKNTPKG